MEPLEGNYNPKEETPAERRRKKAEAEGRLSVSHVRGPLHGHSRTDISKPCLPEEIIENRRGSNCGQVPLDVIAEYYTTMLQHQYFASTDHSRDADPGAAEKGMTDWFYGMYMHNSEWLHAQYGTPREDELSEAQRAEVRRLANKDALVVAGYGDERLEQVLGDIEKASGKFPLRIFRGVEANVKPDGSFDTPMVDQGRFELVNAGIHPNIDVKGFESVINNPEQYSETVLKAIKNPRTNIMAHIGFGCNPDIMPQLQWDEIGRKALENQVAIEINLRELTKYLYKQITSSPGPETDTSWREEYRKKLPELVPMLSDPTIVEKLKPYFEKGLKIAINTDDHEFPFIEATTDTAGTTANFKPIDRRFWRAMKMLEKYFNEIFATSGIRKENIINTFSAEELERFLKKT